MHRIAAEGQKSRQPQSRPRLPCLTFRSTRAQPFSPLDEHGMQQHATICVIGTRVSGIRLDGSPQSGIEAQGARDPKRATGSCGKAQGQDRPRTCPGGQGRSEIENLDGPTEIISASDKFAKMTPSQPISCRPAQRLPRLPRPARSFGLHRLLGPTWLLGPFVFPCAASAASQFQKNSEEQTRA